MPPSLSHASSPSLTPRGISAGGAYAGEPPGQDCRRGAARRLRGNAVRAAGIPKPHHGGMRHQPAIEPAGEGPSKGLPVEPRGEAWCLMQGVLCNYKVTSQTRNRSIRIVQLLQSGKI
jgi:hypothetical protein